MTLTFAVLLVAIALFIWGKLEPEFVALLAALGLFLGGVITAREAVAGFGDPAVVMIAALFVVGEGLSNSGLTAWLSARVILVARGSTTRLLVLVMLGAGILSGFVSNTGTVATLIPAVIAAAWALKAAPSKFLIPLAFAANMGGLLTLTGTPPNIVVSQVLENGGETPLGFFELAWIGFPLLVVGTVYMVFVGQRLLPVKATDGREAGETASVGELSRAYGLDSELCRLKVLPQSPLLGGTLEDAALGKNHGVALLHVQRPGASHAPPLQGETRLEAGDSLVVRVGSKGVESLCAQLGVAVSLEGGPLEPGKELLSEGMGVAEVVIVPRSPHVGVEVQLGAYAPRLAGQVLKARRLGRVLEGDTVRLEEGDALLVRGPWASFETLSGRPREQVVLGNPEAIRRAKLSPRAGLAAGILAGMVALMVTGAVPGAIAALLAALGMVLGGCASRNGSYRSVSWSTIVLIGAMIPMSTALQNSGGAQAVAEGLTATLGELHPLVLLAGIYLLTTALSQVVNNTATAVLMAPIVVQAATGMELSPRPFLIVVTVAASTAFLTPVGTSTNLLVFGAGNYRFADYARVGLPLSLLYLGISLIVVPVVWPL